MYISSTNQFPVAQYGTVNPVQNLRMLAISALVFHAVSNLQMTKAEDPNLEKEICEKLCEPLPGGKQDLAEKVCQETCTKNGVVTKVRKWVGDKAGEWAKPFGAVFDCGLLCGDLSNGAALIASKAVTEAATSGYYVAAGKAAARTLCIIPSKVAGPPGYAACLTCCGGLKYTGGI